MTEKCIHHWIIDSNNIGTCRKCGEVRDFNRLLNWERKPPALRKVYLRPPEQPLQAPVKGRRVA